MTTNTLKIPETMVNDIIGGRKYIKQDVNLYNLPISADGRYHYKSYELDCEKYSCKMMIRQNVDRPDNFSIILVYKHPSIGEVSIIRYNGNHGSHKNRLEDEIITGPHIHIITERYQERTTHPDGYAVASKQYSNLEEALKCFMKRVNIRDIKYKNQMYLEEFK